VEKNVKCRCIDEVIESHERFIDWFNRQEHKGGFVPTPPEVRLKFFDPKCAMPCDSYLERLAGLRSPSIEQLQFARLAKDKLGE
jgi:hypothetical protein